MNEGQEHSPLQDRLTHARARRTSGWRRLALGVGGSVLLAAVAGVGLWIGFLLARDSPSQEAAPPSAPALTTPSAPALTTPSASALTTPSAPALTTPSAESTTLQSSAIKASPPAASSTRNPDAIATPQARFHDAARDFERTEEADLARIQSAPVPGPRAARARIVLNKEKALAAYDDGDADSALRLLDDARQEAAEVLRDAKTHYQRHVQAAKAAYADGDAATARLRITQAQEQWPDGTDAKLWEARIAQLPALLAERGKAEEARAVGDLRAEQTALRRLAELDSTDAGIQPRLQAIDGQLREQAFLRAIARGWQAVDDTNPEQAIQALAEAEQQRPQHAETLRLKTGITALTRSRARARHLADAAQAAARDDWPVALQAFEEAKALTPTHGDAVEGSLLAARITDVQKAMDHFLSRPGRLSSPNIAEAARQTLRDAAPLLTHSPRLATSRTALARAIQDRQTPVPVRVLSDNQTEIGIRGVGVIGRIKEHIIELRPGAYVFEGTRKGYRSKLVTVDVSDREGSSTDVRVVCDERI